MINDSLRMDISRKGNAKGRDGGIGITWLATHFTKHFFFSVIFSILPLILFLNSEPWKWKEDSKNCNFSSIKFTFKKV